MGAHGSSSLQQVVKRVENRTGRPAVTGRYHKYSAAGGRKLTDDYILDTKVLGSGYNGSVHLATTKDGKRYAVKEFKLHGVSKDKKEELETECEIFLGMDHPHVARLTDVYENEESLSLVMECMDGGELFNRVTEKKRFSEKDTVLAAYQMLLAINYIHSHEIVHRDIKLENFLYERKDNDHLKLIDFGFSKIWHPDTKMALSCGTLAYVAPEVLEKSYTSKCDLWSLGVVIFILLVGYMPFSGSESHQVQVIKQGKYTIKKEYWSKVSTGASEFVSKLLVVDPNKRLSAEQALKEDWILKRDQLVPHAEVDKVTADALIKFSQESTFRRACMSMMAWSLNADERTKVRDAFLEMDHEHKGTISVHDFKRVLEDKFHIADSQVQEAFNCMDTTHQGEVHYSEFLAAMANSRIKMNDQNLKQTFRRFDTHNTGYISADDLRELFGETFENVEVSELMNEVKHKGDKISYEEFVEYILHPEADAKHKEIAIKMVDDHHHKNAGDVKGNAGKQKQMRSKSGTDQGGSAGNKAGGNTGSEKKKQGACCVSM